MTTVTYKVVFGEQRARRAVAPAEPDVDLDHEPPPPETAAPSKTARMLALGHYIERLLDQGVLRDLSDAAQRLGLSHAHVTHITALTNLAPGIQSAILDGSLVVSERALRKVSRPRAWKDQMAAISGVADGGQTE